VQCSPIGLSKVKSRHKAGVVYIAFSKLLGAFKVGSASSSIERADGLNRDGYAGATDWALLYRRKFAEAGVVEDGVHTALLPWKVRREYTRRGHGTLVKATEVFSCTYEQARGALESFEKLALDSAIEFKGKM
jgi:T5orf172 domain